MEVINKTESGVKASIVQAIIKVGSLNTAKARMNGTGCVDAQGRHYLPSRNFEAFLSKEFVGSSRKRIEKQLKQNIELFNLIDETRERLSIASLQSEFNSVAEENDTLSTEKTQLSIRCQELSDEKEQLSIDCQSTVNRLSSEAVGMKTKFDSAAHKCQSLSKEIEQLSIKNLATVNRLSDELEEKGAKIDSYKVSVNKLSIEIDSKGEEVERLSNQIRLKEKKIKQQIIIINGRNWGDKAKVFLESKGAIAIVLVCLFCAAIPFTGAAFSGNTITDVFPPYLIIVFGILGAIALEGGTAVCAAHGMKGVSIISAVATSLTFAYSLGVFKLGFLFLEAGCLDPSQWSKMVAFSVLSVLSGVLIHACSKALSK